MLCAVAGRIFECRDVGSRLGGVQHAYLRQIFLLFCLFYLFVAKKRTEEEHVAVLAPEVGFRAEKRAFGF